MTEAKRTPGPWIMEPDFETGQDIIISGSSGRISVACVHSHGDREEEAEVNAALIVRACNSFDDLVEALRDTLQSLEAHLEQTCLDVNVRRYSKQLKAIRVSGVCPCSENEVKQARAALAKAEVK